MNDHIVDAAVNWWADKFTHVGGVVTGDDFLDLSLTLARGQGSTLFASADQIDTFKAELRVALLNPDQDDYRGSALVLKVDYEPKDLLAYVLQESGLYELACRRFPVKTVMWVRDNSVSVKEGYGAEIVTLYQHTASAQAETDDSA